jgi:hypothetical protein
MIKQNRVRRARLEKRNGGKKNSYKISAGKPEGKAITWKTYDYVG